MAVITTEGYTKSLILLHQCSAVLNFDILFIFSSIVMNYSSELLPMGNKIGGNFCIKIVLSIHVHTPM